MENICRTQSGNICIKEGHIRNVNGHEFFMCEFHFNKIKQKANECKCDIENCNSTATHDFYYWSIDDEGVTEKFCEKHFLELHKIEEPFTEVWEVWEEEITKLKTWK